MRKPSPESGKVIGGDDRRAARAAVAFGDSPWREALGGRATPRRSTLIIGAGGLILLVGALLTLGPWLEAQRWQDSPVAAQAERNVAALQVIPLRPTPAPPAQVVPARPTPIPVTQPSSGSPEGLPGRAASVSQPSPWTSDGLVGAPTPVTQPSSGSDEVLRGTSASASQPSSGTDEGPPRPAPGERLNQGVRGLAAPTPTLGPALLQLADAAFQFQDPPQPGANVRLTVTVHNPTAAPGGPVSLDLPMAWLSGYRLQAIDPAPLDGRTSGDGRDTNLRLTLAGPAAGDDLLVTIDFVTTAEVVDAPNLRVLDSEGREVGRAHPPTEAPPGEPGPVYAVDIPRLHLHTGVVQVDWEPPLFVVGQLRASAHVTEGNTVLVGHVRGAAGYNVFDHLDQLTVGDQVIASSRGQTYEFVVSQTQVLPQDDASPTEPVDRPRLTLMTCAGDWNPLTRDYPDRLWVVAEPVDGRYTPVNELTRRVSAKLS